MIRRNKQKWKKQNNHHVKKGIRRLLSSHRRKPTWQTPKPTPTTEEPPEIEWEDIVTTTTEMPATTEDNNWEIGSTISPFEDIKLRQVKEKDVRAERIHVKKIPQVSWASEIKSRLAKLAKNAIQVNEPLGWKEDPATTTTDYYYTTSWDMTTPIPTTPPPTREWGNNWPTPRPAKRRPGMWDNQPNDRWRDQPKRSRDHWNDRRSRQTTPPYDSWGNDRPRYDPPPTHESPQRWNQRGWGQQTRARDTWQRGDSWNNGGWDRRNQNLRSSWGRNRNQEPTEAPDR